MKTTKDFNVISTRFLYFMGIKDSHENITMLANILWQQYQEGIREGIDRATIVVAERENPAK